MCAARGLLLALRVVVKCLRGDFRTGPHAHPGIPRGRHRHLRAGPGGRHPHRDVRSRGRALAIGVLHGLAGSGAVVVLLIAAMPGELQAAAALAAFAPMSIVSTALCSSAFAWLLTRPVIAPVYRTVLIPAFGASGLMFGAWYAGL